MPVTQKKYPEWVQKQRKKGMTVKEKGGRYYLYKRTSRRVPGKKYPQPVDTYVGVITPEGVIEANRRVVTVTDIEVYEYGFTEAVMQLCPESWKKAVGDDWEEYLFVIIKEYSPNTYLKKERAIKTKEDFRHNYGAQVASLNRRLRLESKPDLSELMLLSDIYLICLEKEPVVSRVSQEHKAFLERHGIQLETG